MEPVNPINPESSLIELSRKNARQRSFYFVLWGWALLIANIGAYALNKIEFPYPFVVWLVVIPAIIITVVRSSRNRKKTTVITHLDRVNKWLWIMYGISVFTIVSFGPKINWMINPIIFVVSSIPTITSGITLRFRPLIIGGVLFWLFGIVCAWISDEERYIVAAVAITSGYLIPAHLLKKLHRDPSETK